MRISVVIIARNEEKNISRCVESILKNLPAAEVILVDSASDDHTVEIALKYPINIISLKPDWPLSPAAGRFSGVNNISGKYILFIDGDMELLGGWIEKALEFLESSPRVGAVMGRFYEMYQIDHEFQRNVSKWTLGNDIKKIKSASGSALFRRQALLEAGNFHPYLRAEEEAELSWRLLLKGWDIYRLPYDAVNHYTIPRDTFEETKRRITDKLTVGIGDMFGHCLRKGYFGALWPKFRVPLLFILMIGMIIGIELIGMLLRNWEWVYAGIILFLTLVLAMCIKKRSFSLGILSIVNISCIAFGILIGLFRPIPLANTYPRDVIWIKESL